MSWCFEISRTWAGEPLESTTTVQVGPGGLTVDAPFFGEDTVPDGVGRHPRLWEHEVVEVFLATGNTPTSPYLELEVGPFGHWLVLGFSGYRQASPLPELVTAYEVRRAEGRWRGHLKLSPESWLPWLESAQVGNAFAIHQHLGTRRFCAAFGPPSPCSPDFHRADTYRTLRSLDLAPDAS